MSSERWRKLLPLLTATLAAAACKTLPMREPEGYGLPLVELDVKSEDLATLNSTTWKKIPVPARLTVEGRSYDVEVSYAGKSSLDDFKKSMNVKFRGRNPFRGREKYRLSAMEVDSSLVRNSVGLKIFALMGFDTIAIEPASLWVNDEFRGVYHLVEPLDADFFKARNIDADPVYKALYGNADFSSKAMQSLDSAYDVETKPKVHTELVHIIELVNAPSSPENLEALERLIDVDLYLRYIATAVYLHHFDGFLNNYFFYRDRSVDKYRIAPWDLDRIYERKGLESSGGSGRDEGYQVGVSIWGGNELTAKLLGYPEVKRRYLAILRDLVTRVAPAEVFERLVDEASARIEGAFAHDRVLSSGDRTAAGEAAELKAIAKAWRDSLVQDLETQEATP